MATATAPHALVWLIGDATRRSAALNYRSMTRVTVARLARSRRPGRSRPRDTRAAAGRQSRRLVLRGNGSQQAAGGLRIVEQLHELRRRRRSRRGSPAPKCSALVRPPPGHVARHERQRTRQQRHRRRLDRQRAAAGHGHLRRMADQAEAGDVGARVHRAGRQRAQRLAGGAVQRHHRLHRRLDGRPPAPARTSTPWRSRRCRSPWSGSARRPAGRRRSPRPAPGGPRRSRRSRT